MFEYSGGNRNQCEEAVRARGGVCWRHPNHDLDYLVIGTFVESSWAHEGYGRKIEHALECKRTGASCKIISEAHWLDALQKTSELLEEKRVKLGGQSQSSQSIRLRDKLDETRRQQALLFQILLEELPDEILGKVIERLRNSGLGSDFTFLQPKNKHGAFAGKSFVLTGTLPTLTREAATVKIETAGGKVSGSVTRKTDFVLAGAEAGSKLDQAKKLGVRIVDEKEFLGLSANLFSSANKPVRKLVSSGLAGLG